MTNKPFLRSLAFFACALLISSFAAAAQQERLRLDHLNGMASRATEVVEVSLDETALKALTKLTTLSDRDREQLLGLNSRVRGVYVRGYEFEREGEYSPQDIESIRLQLRTPDWTKIVQVSGRDNSYDEVYLKRGQNDLEAYAYVSTAPKKVCIVNVIGPMRQEDVGVLDREFGISKCGKHANRRKAK